jgi:hypothetical protein
MSAPASGDKTAAFKGLVVTTILLAVMAYSIVLLTNRKFADHAPEGGAPAAAPAAAKH